MRPHVSQVAKISLRVLGVASLVTWRMASVQVHACDFYQTPGCTDPNGGVGYRCEALSNQSVQGWNGLTPVTGDWPCCDVDNPTCACPPPAPPDCP
jgi:hypothetical protein